MIVLDGIIFSLQAAGGVGTYFRELVTRVLERRSDAVLWDYGNSNVAGSSAQITSKRPRMLEPYRPPPAVSTGAIFHSSYYRVAGGGARNVVTVHDFIHERYFGPLRRLVSRRRKKKALRRAVAIICVSETTKADLLRFYPEVASKPVHVIHHGVGSQFAPSAEEPTASQERPFVLFVGKRPGYKNFESAVLGVAAVADIRLVAVGGGTLSSSERSLVARLLPGRFEHVSHVDDTGLNRLYNRAHCLAYPSRYEGFGMPILEAMAAGCPVITTRAGAMLEVAGDAAVLLDDPNAESIASAIRDLASAGLRARYSTLGLSRAALFTWDAAVEKTLAVYDSLK